MVINSESVPGLCPVSPQEAKYTNQEMLLLLKLYQSATSEQVENT